MASPSQRSGSLFMWLILLAATLGVAGAAQWFVPERTVEPIARQFLCDGAAKSTAANSTAKAELLSRVDCVEGLRRRDVTNPSFAILCIPCAVATLLLGFAARRIVGAKPKTRIQRAAPTGW